MNRRKFLTGIAELSVAGLVTTLWPAYFEAKADGRILKGTAEGQIFESVDGGQSWQLIANFGPDCPILEVFQDYGQFYVRIGCQEYSFLVQSLDGRNWWTASSPMSTSLYSPLLV